MRASCIATRIGRALPVVAFAGLGVLLAGCAGSAVNSPAARARPAGSTFCSLRAVVNVRQGSALRSDNDLVMAAERMGIDLDVLQSMGRSSKMVMIREDGPQAECEAALNELRSDPRIESVQRY